MDLADEDLWHRHASLRAFDHAAASLRVAGHVDFGERDALAGQQNLGGYAIGAVAGGVNLDLAHRVRAGCAYQSIWEGALPLQPVRISARRPWPLRRGGAPARRRWRWRRR